MRHGTGKHAFSSGVRDSYEVKVREKQEKGIYAKRRGRLQRLQSTGGKKTPTRPGTPRAPGILGEAVHSIT